MQVIWIFCQYFWNFSKIFWYYYKIFLPLLLLLFQSKISRYIWLKFLKVIYSLTIEIERNPARCETRLDSTLSWLKSWRKQQNVFRICKKNALDNIQWTLNLHKMISHYVNRQCKPSISLPHINQLKNCVLLK